MSLQEFQEQLTKQVLERHAQAQEKIAEYQEQEAAWKMLQAKHECDKAQAEKLASERVHQRLEHQVSNTTRPTLSLRPEMTYDGKWLASYGDVIGQGPTPELACQDFDRVWLGKDEV